MPSVLLSVSVSLLGIPFGRRIKMLSRCVILAVVGLGACLTPAPVEAKLFSNSVTSTVGWSEWCQPGVVTVDLDDGQFRWFQQQRRPYCVSSGSISIVRGTLSAERLTALRTAAQAARVRGLARPECVAGRDSERIVISNGGSAYLLTLVDPKTGISAPGILSCWSNAAFDLQRVLEHAFDVPRVVRK